MRIRFVLLTAAVAASALTGASTELGKPLVLKESVTVSDVASRPEPLVGKVVQVKGSVTEVCQMMGCWMALKDPANGALLRVKVNDGDLVFPKDCIGKTAVAEGTLTRIKLSREQAVDRARHEAEEQGRKFNQKSVKSGTVIYQIAGTGAVILD